MSTTLRLRRPGRTTISVVITLVVFFAALVLWAGRAPKGSSVSLADPGSRAGTAGRTGAVPSGSTPASASGSAAVGVPGGVKLVLPGLPVQGSNDIQNASHLHAVTLEVQSDKPILQLAWAVRQGSPPTGYRVFVKSPVTITSPATGDGVLVQLAAQASDTGTYVRCTVRVDGRVKSTRTVKGAYSVAFCVA